MPEVEADDDALAEEDVLADDREEGEIEVEVEDDKGEGDRRNQARLPAGRGRNYIYLLPPAV